MAENISIENFSGLIKHKLSDNDNLDFKHFSIFPYNPKFLLLPYPGTVLFIENGKFFCLPLSPYSWTMLTDQYSTSDNSVAVIDEHILTLIFKDFNWVLNLYNKEMILTDNNVYQNTYNIENFNTFYTKQINNHIVMTTFRKNISHAEKYERLSIEKFKKENINDLKDEEYRLAPNCVTFILTVKDNLIHKKEFVDYAVLHSFNYNGLPYYIKGIMVLENARTQSSVICSPNCDKYQYVDGLCRYFCKTPEFYIVGITKLEHLLLPYGKIDTLIYIPKNGN